MLSSKTGSNTWATLTGGSWPSAGIHERKLCRGVTRNSQYFAYDSFRASQKAG